MLFLQQLKEQRHFDEFGSNLLNMIVHTCVAIERSVRNETITYNKLNREAYLMSELFKIYQKANEILEDKLDVKLNDDELLFIIDMLEKRVKDYQASGCQRLLEPYASASARSRCIICQASPISSE